MRIGLLSDTHIPMVAPVIPREIVEAFRGVDLILHAGDIFSRPALDSLQLIAPVLAARGDDDDYEDTLADERVKEEHRLTFEGFRLWLIHERPSKYMPGYGHGGHSVEESKQDMAALGWPGSESRLQRGYSPEQAKQDIADIIVFGHEHRAIVEHLGDILLVCPGSPTFLNYHRGLGTVAILDIESGKAQAHILHLEQL